MQLLVISRREVEQHLGLNKAIELVEASMRALSSGESRLLPRRILALPGSAGLMGDMPGALGAGAAFGMKCIAVFPSAPTGRPSHRGAVLIFEPGTGEPVALIEAGALTAVRTAAATAFATRCLARPDIRTLGIFGAGEQARWHIPALLAVRDFQRVTIWARRPEAAQTLAAAIQASASVTVEVTADPAAAANSDVICTLTAAPEPILCGAWLRPGTHVNLVGSSTAATCEADEELVARCRYFVDSEESARLQAAEFLRARASGAVGEAHLLGEIGAVANGAIAGRLGDSDITVYKSLGVIVQDLACGWYLYQQGKAQGFGATVEF
jgi:ornithine cyclodeaminase